MRNEMRYIIPYCSGGADSEIPIVLEIADVKDKLGDKLYVFTERIGGRKGLIDAYRNVASVFSSFMEIYPYVLPAEGYLRYEDKTDKEIGISTCTFSDLKSFYLEAYEKLMSIIYIPMCIDNISQRGSFLAFNKKIEQGLSKINNQGEKDNLDLWQEQDNGWRCDKFSYNEPLQKLIDFHANRDMRNSIGHAKVYYDGMAQKITFYSIKKPQKVSLTKSLLDFAVECIAFAKSSVMLAETIYFLIIIEKSLTKEYSNKK